MHRELRRSEPAEQKKFQRKVIRHIILETLQYYCPNHLIDFITKKDEENSTEAAAAHILSPPHTDFRHERKSGWERTLLQSVSFLADLSLVNLLLSALMLAVYLVR